LIYAGRTLSNGRNLPLLVISVFLWMEESPSPTLALRVELPNSTRQRTRRWLRHPGTANLREF
jgi:hypothetical protein